MRFRGKEWMPWHQQVMKGVASCDNLGGAASRLRSRGARMGKPTSLNKEMYHTVWCEANLGK